MIKSYDWFVRVAATSYWPLSRHQVSQSVPIIYLIWLFLPHSNLHHPHSPFVFYLDGSQHGKQNVIRLEIKCAYMSDVNNGPCVPGTCWWGHVRILTQCALVSPCECYRLSFYSISKHDYDGGYLRALLMRVILQCKMTTPIRSTYHDTVFRGSN